MLGGVLIMGGLGVVVGVGLALASKIFYVYVDPRSKQWKRRCLEPIAADADTPDAAPMQPPL